MMPSAPCLPIEDPFQIEDELIVPGTLVTAQPVTMLGQWGMSDTPPIPRVNILVHEDPFQVPVATRSKGEQDVGPDPEGPGSVLRLADPEVESANRGSQIDPWVDDTVDRLGEIAELAPGWDGHGGNPPQPAYIVEAVTFLASVMRPETPAPSIVPTSDGGLQLEWHRAGLDVEVLFSPEEDNSIYIHERASGSEREVPAISGFLEFDLGRRLVG
jgi:hypothetical protein